MAMNKSFDCSLNEQPIQVVNQLVQGFDSWHYQHKRAMMMKNCSLNCQSLSVPRFHDPFQLVQDSDSWHYQHKHAMMMMNCSLNNRSLNVLQFHEPFRLVQGFDSWHYQRNDVAFWMSVLPFVAAKLLLIRKQYTTKSTSPEKKLFFLSIRFDWKICQFILDSISFILELICFLWMNIKNVAKVNVMLEANVSFISTRVVNVKENSWPMNNKIVYQFCNFLFLESTAWIVCIALENTASTYLSIYDLENLHAHWQ